MKKLRIVFMGTPEFAVGILDTILKNEYEIAAVITAVDKPAGRGQKLKYSAVKEYALANNLTILQPENLKDEAFLAELKALDANLNIVVAFRMLPEAVWRMPELGTFNLHASLLPDYRGAAPINWAIINGEQTTGVTTFFIDDKIDTGAIILKSETDILPDENAGMLHDRLMELGSDLVIKTLQAIEAGNVQTTNQKEAEIVKSANKLNRDNCKIDWSQPVLSIHNQIRGLSPYPAAWGLIADRGQEISVKFYEASAQVVVHDEMPGKIVTTKKEMKIMTKDGFLQIHSLQLPGKKRMTIAEILNGTTFSDDAMAL